MKTSDFKAMGDDFLKLFFPKLCLACRKNAIDQTIICTQCEFDLPETNFHLHKENPVTERFWGRVPIEYGAALYFYSKNAGSQALIHQLKYADKPQVGTTLGEYYGQQLVNSPFQEIDCILPIPLHPKKEYKRGYNQSSKIAQGLAVAMKKPWYNDAVIRTVNTVTQTQKSKSDRFDNVKNAFSVAKPELLKNKHVLLVDDVVTTGATLETCALRILEIGNVKVSVAALAITSD
jgi:competence protein ComFC